MKIKNGKFIILLFFVFCNSILHAKENFSWDFSDCDIKEVLYAISLDTGISITADDTVSGKCDFRFSGDDFNKAFECLLNSSRLFAEIKDDVWVVTKYFLENSETGIKADCNSLKPSLIIEKTARKLNLCITYDSLPTNEISFHLENKNTDSFIESLVRFLPGWELDKTGLNYHIQKKALPKNPYKGEYSIQNLEDGKLAFNIKSALFQEVVEKLFENEKKSFCFLGNIEKTAARSNYVANNFSDGLNILCSQNGFSFQIKDNIYYLIEEKEKKFDFINGKKEWSYFPLKFVKSSSLIPVLNKRFSSVEINENGSGTGIWAKVTETEKTEIENCINQIDVETKTFLIQLKNTKAGDLIPRLPSYIDRESISDADGNCCIHFTGTKDSYEKILKEVNLLDKAPLRLKYDLLILQYDESSENLWTSSISGRGIKKDDATSFGVNLGSVMGLNLNIPLAFGLDFAASLQASINENNTKVFADTSLYGIAGKEINFSNTNTYRYRDNNLDPETGKPVYTGITREIVSGLKLDVLGWVSEDRMITSTVKASITRRGIDSSSITGNPPPTTEKIVTTEVSGKSGEPIVLSGLISESDEDDLSRTPVLSKIPLLGYLFKNKTKRKDRSQMLVVLVPSIDGEKIPLNKEKVYDKEWAKNRMEKLCKIISSN